MSDSREYPSRPIIGVGVVVQKDGAILLVQRGQEPGLGTWTVPGGTVELGEHSRDAARREVREECGVEIEVGELVDTFEFVSRDEAGRIKYHYIIMDFAARYVGGDVCAGSDVQDARWINAGEIDRYVQSEKTRAVIEKALQKR